MKLAVVLGWVLGLLLVGLSQYTTSTSTTTYQYHGKNRCQGGVVSALVPSLTVCAAICATNSRCEFFSGGSSGGTKDGLLRCAGTDDLNTCQPDPLYSMYMVKQSVHTTTTQPSITTTTTPRETTTTSMTTTTTTTATATTTTPTTTTTAMATTPMTTSPMTTTAMTTTTATPMTTTTATTTTPMTTTTEMATTTTPMTTTTTPPMTTTTATATTTTPTTTGAETTTAVANNGLHTCSNPIPANRVLTGIETSSDRDLLTYLHLADHAHDGAPVSLPVGQHCAGYQFVTAVDCQPSAYTCTKLTGTPYFGGCQSVYLGVSTSALCPSGQAISSIFRPGTSYVSITCCDLD